MAYATINKPSDYFNTVLYTGNGTTQSITGVGFQPDWTWIKERSSTSGHEVYDSTRGATKLLSPNATDVEGTNASALTSFDSDGFSVGSGGAVNENSQTYASWNWLANGGTTSSNTDGDVTSTVQVNSTAGFSITTYTGNSSSPLAVGHGLGVAPKVVLAKHRNVSTHWRMWHQGLSGAGYYVILDLTNAQANGEPIFSGLPSSTTVGFLSDFTNTSHDVVFYSFAEIKGFSKFGSYTGNGSADGPFVYTGFKPAWLMIKRTDSTGGAAWYMFDNKRNTFNVVKNRLVAQDVDTEATNFDALDFTSNGFKFRNNDQGWNTSGGTYIYMAFAENPLVGTNGIPATAR